MDEKDPSNEGGGIVGWLIELELTDALDGLRILRVDGVAVAEMAVPVEESAGDDGRVPLLVRRGDAARDDTAGDIALPFIGWPFVAGVKLGRIVGTGDSIRCDASGRGREADLRSLIVASDFIERRSRRLSSRRFSDVNIGAAAERYQSYPLNYKKSSRHTWCYAVDSLHD